MIRRKLLNWFRVAYAIQTVIVSWILRKIDLGKLSVLNNSKWERADVRSLGIWFDIVIQQMSMRKNEPPAMNQKRENEKNLAGKRTWISNCERCHLLSWPAPRRYNLPKPSRMSSYINNTRLLLGHAICTKSSPVLLFSGRRTASPLDLFVSGVRSWK